MVGKGGAVRVHGRLPAEDTVGRHSIGALGGVLLDHPAVDVNGGVAHFQESPVLGVGVLVGVDHGVRFWALGEEVSGHRCQLPLFVVENILHISAAINYTNNMNKCFFQIYMIIDNIVVNRHSPYPRRKPWFPIHFWMAFWKGTQRANSSVQPIKIGRASCRERV